MSGNYDLVIVGGGVSGASLLYTTAKFTDIDSILIQRENPALPAKDERSDQSEPRSEQGGSE